jgi:hypothetical protein
MLPLVFVDYLFPETLMRKAIQCVFNVRSRSTQNLFPQRYEVT